MYKIGQKVQVINGVVGPVTGYIVAMEIDPLEETDVAAEAKEWIIYTIRVYKHFYTNGYTDYHRTERDIKNVDD